MEFLDFVTAWMCFLPVFGFLLPVCVCCVPCEQFVDTFDRADSTSLGADWTETSGNWEIKTNSLYISATGSAICLCNTAVTTGTQVLVTSVVKVNTSGDKVRIMLDYVDSLNYIYAEFSTSKTAVGKRVAGFDTELDSHTKAGDILTVNVDTAIAFCVDATKGYMSATAGAGTVVAWSTNFTPSGSGKWALGTGGIFTGTAYFTTVTTTRTEYGICSTCTVDCTECGTFSTDGVPAAVDSTATFTLTGVGTGTCACAGLNGVYAAVNAANTPCVWTKTISPAVCGHNRIRGQISYAQGWEALIDGAFLNTIVWRQNTGGPHDCAGVSALNLPYVSGGGSGNPCLATSSTMTLTTS